MKDKRSSYHIEFEGCSTVLLYIIVIVGLIASILYGAWEHKLDIEYKQKIINQPETITNITEKVH